MGGAIDAAELVSVEHRGLQQVHRSITERNREAQEDHRKEAKGPQRVSSETEELFRDERTKCPKYSKDSLQQKNIELQIHAQD